jgi:tRNA(Ile)-lysidine synthase
MDLKEFEQICIEKCGLDKNRPILVGVSGGADSFCLAELFFRCGFIIILAHFDHHLRETSGRDARVVESFARSRHLPFVLGGEDIKEYSRKNSFSIEEGARNARYDFLFTQAKQNSAQAVATGHTADDQAETVLMHFIRGSGVSGLKGMPFRGFLKQFNSGIPLVRPLLGTPRAETERICAEFEVGYLCDESNSDQTYFRNKLRLELIPLLETYQPGFRKRLGQTGILMAEVDEALQGMISDAFTRAVINDGPDYFILSMDRFSGEKKAVQRGLLREVIHRLRDTLRDVDFDAVERVMNLLSEPANGKRVEIIDRLEAVIEGNTLVIKDANVEVIDPDQLWIQIKESFQITKPEGIYSIGNCNMKLSIIPGNEFDLQNLVNIEQRFTAYLDMKSLNFPLTIRTRKDGDRITPFGMGGHSMKLADFWINSRLPRKARDNWPLVCSRDEICWIPGYRIMDPYRVNSESKEILVINVVPN